MKVHELKIWPRQLTEIVSGLKRYEIRKNDRDFAIGDRLLLREYVPETGRYTGKDYRVVVTWMTPGGHFGLPEDLCVMSIERSHDLPCVLCGRDEIARYCFICIRELLQRIVSGDSLPDDLVALLKKDALPEKRE